MTGLLRKYRTLIGIVLIILILGSGAILIYTERSTAAIEVIEQYEETEDNSGEKGLLVVDVEGAVANPGVYELSIGSRIEDALNLAGGLTKEADIDSFGISRAARLEDEQLIVVPKKQDGQSPEQLDPPPAASNCISVNQASVSELDSLPGIGEARAAGIIENRPYASLDQLVAKQAIPQYVFDEIAALVCI